MGLLVLRRKETETIVIGHNIRVTVVRIAGGKVMLAVQAPSEVPVHREEVYQAILRGEVRGNIEGATIHGRDAGGVGIEAARACGEAVGPVAKGVALDAASAGHAIEKIVEPVCGFGAFFY